MKKLETFVVRNVAGDFVMMPTGKTALKFSGLINTNEVGAFIWNRIDENHTEEDIVNELIEEFEVSKEEAAEDVHTILQHMIVAKWIEL